MIKYYIIIAMVLFPTASHATDVVVFLTSGTSWVVPGDWDSTRNTIEAIGGGGGGTAANIWAGGGGGGGRYVGGSSGAGGAGTSTWRQPSNGARAGPGGGGAGAARLGPNGAAGGLYGGGGGGDQTTCCGNPQGTAGSGAQGIIVVTYFIPSHVTIGAGVRLNNFKIIRE